MAVRGLAGRETVRGPGRPLLSSAVSELGARAEVPGRATPALPRSEALTLPAPAARRPSTSLLTGKAEGGSRARSAKAQRRDTS